MTAEPPGATADLLRHGGNAILAAAGSDDLDALAPAARRHRFARGDIMIEEGEVAPDLFFIMRGVASFVKPADGERATELCLIGPEGLAGSTVVMTGAGSEYRCFVQSDGLDAIAIAAPAIRSLFAHSEGFRALLLPAIHAQTLQIADSLIAALWYDTQARLARWLLMYRDRLRSDRLEVTHDFLALMVGAYRTRITAALHELEATGAIVAARGVVVVRDPALLKRLAQGSYG